MIKKFLILLLIAGWLNAALTNGVAVIVNDSVVTLYDIDEAMTKKNLSQNQAITMLIDKILYEDEISRFNISVPQSDLDDYLVKLAQSNGMSLEQFQVAVKRQQSYTLFLGNIKKRLLNQKLISKIASGKLKIASDEDMKLYYENNMEQFRVNKDSIQIVPFEQAKDKVFNMIMSEREQKYLKEYFETLKITADIKIVR